MTCAQWSVSARRACAVLQACRSSYAYKGTRPDQAQLKTQIKEIAEIRVRYGYRRIHTLLRREGWEINMKRVYRLYKEMGLQLRNKTPKRRVKAKLRDDRDVATSSNEVWAMGREVGACAILFMTHWQQVVSCVSSPSSIHGRAIRQALIHALAIRERMLFRRLSGYVRAPAIRRQYGSIKDPSLSRGIWIYGLTRKALHWTSRVRESRPITLLSRALTANSALNA